MKKIKKLLFKFLFILLLWQGSSQATQAVETIRIGYQVNYGVFKTPFKRDYPGYGFEYLSKIVEYTQGDYELDFVPCSLDEGLYLLRIGLIDVFASGIRTSEWEENYLFTDTEFARDLRILSSTDPNYSYTGDVADLTDVSIAVQIGDPVIQELTSFLNEIESNAKVIELDIKNYTSILNDNSYDFVLASSLLMDSQPEMAFMISDHPSYLMALPHNSQLIADLNYGMVQVEANEYLFKEKLTLKYFDKEYNLSDMITKSEYQLMKMQNPYYVGIEDTNSPFAYVDEDGNIAGIYADVFNLLAKDIGIFPEYVVLNEHTTLTEENSLDFNFLTVRNEKLAANTQSKGLFHIPYLVVRRSDHALDAEDVVVGTLDYYGLLEAEINLFVPTENVKEFPDETALRLAFEAGAVDVLFITSSTYDAISNLLDPYFTISSEVDYYFSPTLNFDEDYPTAKIEILNKFIDRLPDHEVELIIQSHSRPTKEPVTFEDIRARYPIIVGSGFILISLGFFLIFLLERSKKREIMQKLSVDSLTGLMTEYSFNGQVNRILTQFPDKKYAIISVDIDNFKYINEVYGYEAGSEFLKELALFLNELLEYPVVSTRTSCDHFLYLVEQGDLISHLEQSIGSNRALLTLCGSLLPANYTYGFSMGMYPIDSNEITVPEMIDCANYARYEGKEEHGSTFHLFTEEMKGERAQNSTLLTSVETAFEQGEFVLHYQESIDVKTKHIRHTEVLLRWNRGGQQILPEEFLPILEVNGYLVDLDFYVLDRVCQLIARQRELSLPPFSVNLTSETVQEPHFQENLLKLIESYKVQPTQIQLEIPESVFWDASPVLLERLESLQGVGFRFVVDDFSGNLSFFSHVKGLPFDSLKLDPSFVTNSMKDRKSTGILSNLIKICKNFHLEIAVKKVETQEEFKFVKSVGADTIQGYYLCKTRSLDEFLNHFKSGNFHKNEQNAVEIEEEAVPEPEPEEEPVVLQLGKQVNRFARPQEDEDKNKPKEGTLSVELRNLEPIPEFLEELPAPVKVKKELKLSPPPSYFKESKISESEPLNEEQSEEMPEEKEMVAELNEPNAQEPPEEPMVIPEEDLLQSVETLPQEESSYDEEDENKEDEEVFPEDDGSESTSSSQSEREVETLILESEPQEEEAFFLEEDANHTQDETEFYENESSLEEALPPSSLAEITLTQPAVMVPETVLSQESLNREEEFPSNAPLSTMPSGALEVSFPEFLSESEPPPKQTNEKVFDTQKIPSFTAFPRKKVSLETPSSSDGKTTLPRAPEILKKKKNTPLLSDEPLPAHPKENQELAQDLPPEELNPLYDLDDTVEDLDLEIPDLLEEIPEETPPTVPHSIKSKTPSSEKNHEGKIPNRVKERLVSSDKSLESTGRIPNRVKERLNIQSNFNPSPTKKQPDEKPSVFSPGELEEVDLDPLDD